VKASESRIAFIGYPKAASTLLYNYFTEHPDISASLVRLTPLSGGSKSASSAVANEEQGTPGARVRILINEKIAESVLIVGDSRAWNKNRFVPGAWDKVQDHVRIDPLEAAKRVRQGYAVGRVLIVVRDQLDWLQSAYKYFFPRLPADHRSFADFCATPRGIAYLKAGHFDQTIEAYQRVFGRRNVLVMHVEDLAKDPEAFAHKLCEFISVEPRPIPKVRVNPGSANRMVSIRTQFPIVDKLPVGVRALGKALVTKLLPAKGSIMTPREAAEIRARYAESNARMKHLLETPESAPAHE
jgi:Sulfotransferase family